MPLPHSSGTEALQGPGSRAGAAPCHSPPRQNACISLLLGLSKIRVLKLHCGPFWRQFVKWG